MLAGLVLAGCGGVDRDEYVGKNTAVLASIPVFPGAHPGALSSSGYRERDTADAEIAGYGTSREDRLPPGTAPAEAYDWYLRALERRDWRIGQRSAGAFFEAVRGSAYVAAQVGAGIASFEVDHDCINSAGQPRCFGP